MGTGSQALPLSELLEDNAVWKALSAYTDPLQHAITPQLIQNKVGVKFTSLQKKNGQFMVIEDVIELLKALFLTETYNIKSANSPKEKHG